MCGGEQWLGFLPVIRNSSKLAKGVGVASLSKDGKTWRIRFVDGCGKRLGIRLPGFRKSEAEVVLSRVKELIVARISNQALQTVTATWLAGIETRLRTRLEATGLVNPPEATPDDEMESEPPKAALTLTEFLRGFIERRKTKDGLTASQATINKWEGTAKLLLSCLESNRPLDSLALEDARNFRQWMEKRKIPITKRNPTGRMKENSIRQRMANCKTFFAYAVAEEMIAGNPFRNQYSTTLETEEGKVRIPADVIESVIDAAPSAQWRLLIALWRFAGLRKTEPLLLNWSDVVWDYGKLRVTSPKTRNYKGKKIRYVPTRDIEPYLLDAAELANGDERIISMYSVTMTNLNKPFVGIIEKAGHQIWPNLIKNLRMSCENDWLDANEAPAHVIAAWMGHDIKVQNSHYAMVSDGHFEQFNRRKKDASKATPEVDHLADQ